ncbi:F-box/LRR-repeat protein At4g14103-like [Mercurialis annua]|uniref:F-box/LRR-repeat protein At4g14103-like n=1 Tax=Mercurialis annua TaxID=3986 RepID=UPI0021602A9F|nr:F-box/LRR-repeat protein At4g14103-like [Mercurialis annua]XP_055959602.1 F-box/LRR-repeat protein At4g14103-like [Mercurialis annua]
MDKYIILPLLILFHKRQESFIILVPKGLQISFNNSTSPYICNTTLCCFYSLMNKYFPLIMDSSEFNQFATTCSSDFDSDDYNFNHKRPKKKQRTEDNSFFSRGDSFYTALQSTSRTSSSSESEAMVDDLLVYDQFSNLPDDIIHQIMFNLGNKDLAGLNLTSRRFRDLCLTRPCPVFDSTKHLSNKLKRHEFILHITNFFANRKKVKSNKEIKRFSLRWHCQGERNHLVDERSLVEQWIDEVVDSSFSVRELVLHLGWPERKLSRPFLLPVNQSLKYLELSVYGDTLTLPSVNPNSDMISLERLSMFMVKVDENQNLGEWISQSCKKLNRLVLNNCVGFSNLEIKSDSIEHLAYECTSKNLNNEFLGLHISAPNLKQLHITWKLLPSNNKSVTLHTPNLEFLNWNCYPVQNCDMGQLNSLKRASVSFPLPSLHQLPRRHISANGLSKLMQSIQAVKFLNLNSLYIETLFIKGFKSVEFRNLETLKLEFYSEMDNKQLGMISWFLKTARNLELISTSIYGGRNVYTPVSKPLEFQNLPISEFQNRIARMKF